MKNKIAYNQFLNIYSTKKFGYFWAFDIKQGSILHVPQNSEYQWLEFLLNSTKQYPLQNEDKKKLKFAIENKLVLMGSPKESASQTHGLYIKNPLTLVDTNITTKNCAKRGLVWERDELINNDPGMPNEINEEANSLLTEYMFNEYSFGSPGDIRISKLYPLTAIGIYRQSP